ncbi:MAG: hypothetical protein NTZ85_09650 [Bacteroidia bacterium]|nr:hypothetical protein [Bacteroidia bacterium]
MKRKLTILIVFLITGMLFKLSGQATSSGSMPQYLFAEFTKCDIKMISGQTQTQEMNYNTVTEKMVFTRDKKYYDLTNPEMIDTIILQNCRFVPAGKAFYEVLVSGPLSLFLQHKGDLMTAGKPVGYGGTSQVASSNYINNIEMDGLQVNLQLPNNYIVNPSPVYWIRNENKWFSFNGEKQFLKIFPDKAVRIKGFIKENRIKFDKPGNLIRLVKYCSTL